MKPFFIGWSGKTALPLLGFLGAALLALITGFGALAFALGVSVDDPGGGDFTGDKVVTGVLIADPYPMIVTASVCCCRTTDARCSVTPKSARASWSALKPTPMLP